MSDEQRPAPWEFEKLRVAPRIFPAPAAFRDSKEAARLSPSIRAFCYQGPSYRGRTTRVFALYGRPPGATADAKVPGIVLVHGGGGTAFAEWVRRWVERGYAALAMDHDGGLPIGSHAAWARNPEHPGPRRVGAADVFEPVENQWMYHAVADTVLAGSLLAAFPEVDAGRVGLCGISWGAVVACNALAADPRLKFGALVYGCGFIAENEDDGSRFIEQNARWEDVAGGVTAWRERWDPKQSLGRVTAPLLWLNGTNDFAFTPRAWGRSHRRAPGTRALCLRVRMPHGHGEAGEAPEEMRVFADSITQGGVPLARSLGQGSRGREVWADFDAVASLRRAEVNFACDGLRWQDRRWETRPAVLDGSRARAELPAEARLAYFNVIDERDLVSSGDLIFLAGGSRASCRGESWYQRI